MLELTLGISVLGLVFAFLFARFARPFARMVGGLVAFVMLFAVSSAFASEKDLILPDLASVRFMGIPGNQLLMVGLLVCFLGLAFGLVILNQLKNITVHRAMREK